MNIVESDKKKVVVCGDIHGEFETLVYNLKINNITDSLIIVAGDCGFGFHKASYYDMLYKRLAPKLRTQGNIIFFVRGNHDDPDYFDGKTFVKKYMRCLADYTVVSVAGRNILCVGGAISIDREPRLREMELNRILGLTLVNSHAWTVCFTNCVGVNVREIAAFGYRMWSDGIMLSDYRFRCFFLSFI